jgi:hypothetical protein
MPDKGWHRTSDDPIPLPDGSELRTLRDAGNYIAGLPKREHGTFAWRAAIEALMLVAEHGGDTVPEDWDHPGAVSWRDGADARKKRAKKYWIIG